MDMRAVMTMLGVRMVVMAVTVVARGRPASRVRTVASATVQHDRRPGRGNNPMRARGRVRWVRASSAKVRTTIGIISASTRERHTAGVWRACGARNKPRTSGHAGVAQELDRHVSSVGCRVIEETLLTRSASVAAVAAADSHAARWPYTSMPRPVYCHSRVAGRSRRQLGSRAAYGGK